MTLNRPICSPSVLLTVSFFLYAAVVAASAKTFTSFSNETDYRALLAFKAQITSDPSEVLSSWNDSLHFCDWMGVTCGKRHRQVTRLNLTSLGLVGPLSPHVGNLSFLRVLNLTENGFHGAIPEDIGRLPRLQVLLLKINSFGGELPTNLTYCRDLSVISLGGNSLRGRIPPSLGSMLKLTVLDLSLNQFTGEIPPSLGNLSSLAQLFLAYDHLKGSVPPELGNLSNLKVLQVAGSNLSGSIPPSLYNISSIEHFGVARNYLSGTLPSDLFLTLPNLQGLYLGNNIFSGQVPSSITNASQLVEISLAFNSFVGPIPTDLSALKNLQRLLAGANLLGTEEGDDLRFLTSLTNCTQLRAVDMVQNRLKGALPDSIGNFSANLTSLALSVNLISGTIPSEIGNLVNLEGLLLRTNMLVATIPESIGKLSNLQDLRLSYNNLVGAIPTSIGNMSLLNKMFLRGNMLEGVIPVSLGNCTKLISVDLSQNRLTGPVPEQLFGASSIEILLAGNYLIANIPSRVGKLVNLQALDVSKNNMSGQIPPALGSCTVLEVLLLSGNRFHSTIPSQLGNLRGLRLFDVSQNNLSGQIPEFLASLYLIENLNLSFNKFEGEVPNFRNLSAVSIAGNRKLCGGPLVLQLPPCKNMKRSLSRRRGFMIGISVSIFILLVGGIITTILCRSKQSRKKTTLPSLTADHYPNLSYAELLQATNGFSSTNVIGEGSFGVVYRGALPSNGQVVAVKVLKLEERGASRSFMAECEALRNVRHRNLVKTITALPNGSLDKWLHPDSNDSTELGALQRLNIAIDAATGLDYLHNSCDIPIVHCDLKPSNVLLESDFSAHLSDFGLAKFLMPKEASGTLTSSIGLRGTIGYVAPEYGIGGEVSTQGDVYSFGILLLELFTGKRPTGPMFSGQFSLREFVEGALPDGLDEVMDPVLRLREASHGDGFHQCLATIMRVGITCSAAQPTERMDIREAVEELRKARDILLVRRRRNRL